MILIISIISIIVDKLIFFCLAMIISSLTTYFFIQVVYGVLYKSRALVVNVSGRDQSHLEASGRDTVRLRSEHNQTLSVRSTCGSLVTHPQFVFTCKLELKSLDMVLHKSRKIDMAKFANTLPTDRETGSLSAANDISHNGIYISVKHSVMELKFKGQDMDVMIDTTGFRCSIFRYLTEFHGSSDKSELNNLLGFLDFITEASISHSKFCFCLRNLDEALPSASLCSASAESGSHGTESLHDHWLFIRIVISQIYMAGCPIKDILAHDFEELNAAFSVGGEFQSISCECKVLCLP